MSIIGAAIGGGLVSAAGDLLGGSMTSSANAKQAAMNRDWQERMSNTSHQRQVADMRAAGLNPMLSGMGGSGAATGSGAQASAADMSSIGSRSTGAASTAQQVKINKPQMEMSDRIGAFLKTDTGKKLVPAASAKALGLDKEAQAVITAEHLKDTSTKKGTAWSRGINSAYTSAHGSIIGAKNRIGGFISGKKRNWKKFSDKNPHYPRKKK